MNIHTYLTPLSELLDSLYTLRIADVDTSDEAYQAAVQHWNERVHTHIAPLLAQDELSTFAQRFNLDAPQLALCLLCLLPRFDERARYPIERLQGSSSANGISLELLLYFVSDDRAQRAQLRASMQHLPVFKWQVLQIQAHTQLGDPMLMPSAELLSYFAGAIAHSDANECATLLEPPKHTLVANIAKLPEQSIQVISLIGEAGIGKKSAALQLSGQRPLYVMNHSKFAQFTDKHLVLSDVLRLLLCQGGDLYWPQGQQLLNDAPELVRICADWLSQSGGRLYLVDDAPFVLPLRLQDIANSSYELSLGSHIELANILQAMFVAYSAPDQIVDINYQQVCYHYPMTPAQLRALVNAVVTSASQQPITSNEVLLACVAHSARQLGELATRITPRFEQHDLILSADGHAQLNELVMRFEHRYALESQGVELESGTSALFWGRPGTGKTMAAEVLAKRLHLPLYKVNLANIASKWIGETEKHLAQLFDMAERQHSVLFFDEADAVFAKRSEVESSHDKNANLGVSYLLQRIERFTGVLILATNFKGNIDDAFLRRLSQSVEFTLPDEPHRLKLWQSMLKGHFSYSADIELKQLAQRLVFSAAQIKNCVRHAMLLATAEQTTQLSKAHIAAGAHREYQKQDGNTMVEHWLKQWALSK
ncbi:ATP-binding protein [Pseudoalteromonas sp. JBTF-M23]|uniref:ATP-binding protein n=1 Tax=Pseudoalteromonas caenipelagi TaxID=2726988 RepID=A0A849VFQ5_9GAMM|nr:ATP-binding protein [Pseudoalteromonas caenipelagi]NOU50557.1 ATP-binding protein [Pseudoalteromonas caenipelagi]